MRTVEYSKYRMQKSIDVEWISSFFYFLFDDSFSDELERHEMWELVYLDRGECYVHADGERFRLSQGELCFHKPFESHMLEIEKGGRANALIMSFFCASPAMRYFEGRRIAATQEIRRYLGLILNEATHSFAPPFHKEHSTRPLPMNKKSLFGSEQAVMNLLELMLLELVRGDPAREESAQSLRGKELVSDDFCRAAIAYMEEHLYEPISVEALCRSLAFSRSYVSRRFQAGCGMPLSEYYLLLKLREAQRLIRRTDMTFQEISERMMFANPHYFSTCFKRHLGMTPTQYRQSCRQEYDFYHYIET